MFSGFNAAGGSGTGAGATGGFGAFGSTNNNTTNPTNPAPSTTGFTFGGPSASGSTTPASKPAFGFGATSGSTTPAGQPPAQGLFGGGGFGASAPSGTQQQSGSAASGGMFGSTGGGGLFGAKPAAITTGTSAPANPFGAPAAGTGTTNAFGGFRSGGGFGQTTQPAASVTGGAATSSGPFGASAPAGTGTTGSIFGGGSDASGTTGATTTPTPAQATGGLFGGNSGSAGFGGLSGAAKPAAVAPAATAGGFSFGGSATNTTTGNTTSNANNPFGAPPASGGTGLFGQPAQSATTGSTGFGQPSAGAGLFGAKPAGNVMGGSSTTATQGTNTPTSLFGTPAVSVEPSKTTQLGQATTSTPTAAPPAFGGFNLNNNTSKPATTGLFGQPASTTPASSTSTAAAAPASGGLFAGFGAPKDAAKPSTTAPTTGLFGAPPAASSTATAPAPAPAPAVAPDASKTAAPPANNLFGGFAAKPAAPSGTTTPTAAPAPATPAGGVPNLFGGIGAKPATASTTPAAAPPATNLFGGFKPAEAAKTTTTPASSDVAKPASTGLFGAAPAAATTTSTTDKGKLPETTAAAPKSSSGFSFGGQTTGPTPTATAQLPTAGTSASTVAPGQPAASAVRAKPEPIPSMLENKTHGEIVQEMNRLLEARVEQFESAAAEVREWDRMLIRNAAQVHYLHTWISQAEANQSKVLGSLDTIERHQTSLGQNLEEFEKYAQQQIDAATKGGSAGRAQQPADVKRAQAAETAKSLFRQLENVDKDLSSMIDEVNRLSVSTSLPTNGEDHSLGANKDPVHQITAILNTHVTSLEWINNQTAKLKEEVGSLEAAHEKATGVELGRSMSQSMSASRSGALGTSTSSLGRSGLRRSGFVNSPRQR